MPLIVALDGFTSFLLTAAVGFLAPGDDIFVLDASADRLGFIRGWERVNSKQVYLVESNRGLTSSHRGSSSCTPFDAR